MRAVVQRVSEGHVEIEGAIAGKIGPGLVVLLGVGDGDCRGDVEYLAEKIVNLRIFEDTGGKMNLSLLDTGGSLLIVSQFTLYGDCRKGRRPGFDAAARPETARLLYGSFVDRCREYGIHVETGVFQAEMKVSIQNEGPVTLLLDSRKEF